MDDQTMQRLERRLYEILFFQSEPMSNNMLAGWQIENAKTAILKVLAAEIERAEVTAQTNAVAWAVSVVDDLHNRVHIANFSGDEDKLYKGIKNTLRDRYKAEIGVDPAPDYHIHAKLKPKTGGGDE